MTKIIDVLCPSVSNHLLLKMQIIKVFNPHPLSKDEFFSVTLLRDFHLKFLRNVLLKYLEERGCSLSSPYLRRN